VTTTTEPADPVARSGPAAPGHRRKLLLAALSTTVVALPAAGPADATAEPAATRSEPALEVVASGLDHPRGLAALPGGAVLVAEAGRAGEAPCLPASPGTGNQPACLSATGAVTLVRPGRQTRVLDGLASIGPEDGTAVSGPHDLAPTSDGLRIVFGFANNPSGRADLGEAGASLGQLALVDHRGRQRNVGDLAAHEGSANPDGRPGFAGSWSNPYSIVPAGRDTFVSDSGGNDILRVTPGGRVATVAVLPAREVPAPPGAGLPPGSTITMEPVPTGMVRGPDGALYVGELTGAPGPAGAARVFRVVPGRAPEVVHGGFTAVSDVAFDRQGRLLVLEIFTNGLTSGNPAGALKRVEADGSVTTLIDEGLVTPTAMAVAHDGAIYISNRATSVGGGEVVRFVPPSSREG
jgi:hypothetical protein